MRPALRLWTHNENLRRPRQSRKARCFAHRDTARDASSVKQAAKTKYPPLTVRNAVSLLRYNDPVAASSELWVQCATQYSRVTHCIQRASRLPAGAVYFSRKCPTDRIGPDWIRLDPMELETRRDAGGVWTPSAPRSRCVWTTAAQPKTPSPSIPMQDLKLTFFSRTSANLKRCFHMLTCAERGIKRHLKGSSGDESSVLLSKWDTADAQVCQNSAS